MARQNRLIKIAICGSLWFYREMIKVGQQLQLMGYEAIIPDIALKLSSEKKFGNKGFRESSQLKILNDSIRKHYENILTSDAILVLNYEKNGVRDYIGGNTFLEIGYAYILRKKIFLLNNIPKNKIFYDEIIAMKPIVLGGNVSKIKDEL